MEHSKYFEHRMPSKPFSKKKKKKSRKILNIFHVEKNNKFY